MSEKEQPFEGAMLTLTSEDGEEIQFEHLDTVLYEGSHYFALSPVLDAETYLDADGELVLMRVELEDGEEVLVGIDEEDPEFDAVWALFEERLAEEYEIIDGDDEA